MRNLSVGVSAIKKVCILLMSLASALGTAAQNVPEDQASISGRVVDVSGSPIPHRFGYSRSLYVRDLLICIRCA